MSIPNVEFRNMRLGIRVMAGQMTQHIKTFCLLEAAVERW